MRARALIAAGIAAAMLSGGAAAAADGGDDPTTIGAAHTAAAPAAPGGDVTAPDAGTQDDLSAAMSGSATVALTQLNQARAQRGLPTLREEPGLTTLAQSWATNAAAIGSLALDPDLGTAGKPLPGYPVDGFFVELGSQGDILIPLSAHVANLLTNKPEFALDPKINHVGIGWQVSGTKGFLYLIAVEYQFTDLSPTDTFYQPVEWLASASITTGYPDGSFRPAGEVTREAMAAFLYRFLNKTSTLPACTGDTRMFTDVTAAHPFCGAIEWLATQNITTGWPDRTFRPGQPVSREAMGAFLYRAFTKSAIPACAAGARTFTDVTASHPFCGAIEWLATQNITTGWPDHSFRPGLSVERQAMAAFLFRAAVD